MIQGGNSLDKAPASNVYDFVKANGGHTVITKVLIANNGIAAVKEIRSIRQWSYETFGRERAVEFTVMATPEDLKVNAEYIRMADQYIEVPGGSNNNNYANVDLIVDIAERAGVHAVWAGWGHASENPRLPESLAASKNKIIFIGPPGSAMRSLGDKISSTIVAQSANVPTMPWSGTGITDTVLSESGYVTVPDKAYADACVSSVEEGMERAEEIGYPVMIKASEGGGGKGIRKVDHPDGFKNAYHAASGEIPGSPIFIMKLAGQARHLEVQLLADQYGNAISLFGRDCSVQRRHQKIIEEAPVTIAKEETFEQMERAAVRLSKLVGYVSAGTVEYLYSHADDSFYFLELNPRLQVEHPTTEMVSGVNLPAAQLQVAMGLPLHRIRDIRQLYGVAPGSSEIDFEMIRPDANQLQRKPRPKGHVVAVRITAENPDAGFKPSSGSLQELNFRSSTNVWGYFSVSTAGGLHEFADSQFGHIFAYGEDRSESRKNMIVALKELSIRGDFRTTVEYLIKLLELEAFKENTITTGWLDSLISSKLTAERPDATLAVVCGAVTKAYLASDACWTEYKRVLEKGQVPGRDVLKTVFGVDFIYENTRYSFTAARSSSTVWTLYLNGGRTMVGARPLADGGLLVLLDGRSHSIYWREEVGALRLMVDAKTCLIEQENDPTQLRSPSPGKLVRFFVDSGDHVNAGDQYAEIEVMKMYMPLIASEDGVIQLIKQPGVSLEPGDILGILTLDDPARVKHAKPFEGLLPQMGAPGVMGSKPHQTLNRCMGVLNDILDGFDNQSIMASTLKELVKVLHDPELPYSEVTAILSSLSGRMPAKLEETIRSAMDIAKAKGDGHDFPAVRIKKVIDNYIQDHILSQDRAMFRTKIAGLYDVLERYLGGLKGHETETIANLLSRYEATEKLFGGSIEARVLALRDQHKDDLDKVVGAVLSHIKVQSKVKLVFAVLDYVKTSGLNVSNTEGRLYQVLQGLASLEAKSSTPVSLKAREVLILGQMPSYEERLHQMETVLKNSVTDNYYGEQHDSTLSRTPSAEVLKELSDSRYTVFDVLPSFFDHEDPMVRLAALEVYVRRAYKAYTLLSIDYEEGEVPTAVTWRFNLGRSHSPPSTPRLSGGEPPRRAASVSDLTFMINRHQSQPVRIGAIASFPNLPSLSKGFNKVVSMLPVFDKQEFSERYGANNDAPNVVNIALRIFRPEDDLSEEAWHQKILDFVNKHSSVLTERGVRRISIMLCRMGQYPVYFTLRDFSGIWGEEQAIRNIEPALAFQLELSRLSNYNLKPCFVEAKQIHIYHAIARENQLDNRFFIRALVRPGRLRGSMTTAEYLISETDRLVTSVLDALEIVSAEHRNADCNHIFMNFVYNLAVGYEDVLAAISGFIERHGKRLWRLHVTSSEIRIALEDSDGNVTPIRCTIENVSGFIVNYHGYQEITTDKGTTILKSIGDKGPLHLQPVHQAYPTKESLQPKRYQAHLIGTTYVYDFPDLFSKALHNVWIKARNTDPSLVLPKSFLESKELVLDEHDRLTEVDRAPGNNNFGMVGWVFTLRTPEFPQGRKVVVVANDITYKIGSFGPVEDQFFYQVTQYARERGLPRIYLSANSGARLGLAEEVIPLFSTAWKEQGKPEKGFDYLYLTPENFLKLQEKGANSVRTEEIKDDGERRFKITDIIGLQEGLGVESLKGSGLIAGETSRAYNDIFTITLVTARSVGIGAYLVRLGERAVQVEGQPIILTGAQALNKVLGREVYTSNLQLGGTQIMFKNGVSHLTAGSDLQGATHILEWLSYVPEIKNGPLPVRESSDSWDRDIGYLPPKGAYDPRWFIEGKIDENTSEWTSGFFDKDSFQETLSGWAQTVVVGRARLGGIPMGVIAVETRTIERLVPADPANPASFEQRIMEAGQVWYPNSAYKTAQAIFDFDREGLPLIIFANWRGFSGGQQDMYDEVLKQGSKIVDGLSSYKQPVFVYIVPNGELRGGAWVVLDPSINSEQMEMYADVDARAGVLEPEGIIEIKMRRDKIRSLMERLDSTYASLNRDSKDASKSEEERSTASTALAARETFLQPTYKQIAILYADLHDRTGRMEAKGCAKPAVWRNARRYFYWAVRARVARSVALADLAEASPGISFEHRSQLLDDLASIEPGMDYRQMSEALEKLDLTRTLAQLRADHLMRRLVDLTKQDHKAAMESFLRMADHLSDEDRTSLIGALQGPRSAPLSK
ncbi:ACC1, acetyl-CoA carboxylase, cytosolic [Laccaria bicolor S238N-H82]|uniref:ACC1, acetyl-CoA carboxylase, cytosolic n=1 Tax=Laccaria bicolor (strain S238N-H82 / ATCC MYA-4686) TaxID=486041 RepID=B0CUD8_LACBS|nr:ACC1, acetyl-CoA carboxylase, cytosolic [Laccaria bicolor S238N-H82]EDR14651.1 ACC1, acetyl-CoA carboxylase, cytosolic [Laccaria bicolor S238N-H82]|eukprot:XP_001875210.1 ACC1, acetyl-CoA carboxylase, cytosolic [Laccaria bicolor S238N-H82]